MNIFSQVDSIRPIRQRALIIVFVRKNSLRFASILEVRRLFSSSAMHTMSNVRVRAKKWVDWAERRNTKCIYSLHSCIHSFHCIDYVEHYRHGPLFLVRPIKTPPCCCYALLWQMNKWIYGSSSNENLFDICEANCWKVSFQIPILIYASLKRKDRKGMNGVAELMAEFVAEFNTKKRCPKTTRSWNVYGFVWFSPKLKRSS